MGAWLAEHKWWLLPVLAGAVFLIKVHDGGSGEPLHRRIIYAIWPALEPDSPAQSRALANFLGAILTVAIMAVVAVVVWAMMGS